MHSLLITPDYRSQVRIPGLHVGACVYICTYYVVGYKMWYSETLRMRLKAEGLPMYLQPECDWSVGM